MGTPEAKRQRKKQTQKGKVRLEYTGTTKVFEEFIERGLNTGNTQLNPMRYKLADMEREKTFQPTPKYTFRFGELSAHDQFILVISPIISLLGIIIMSAYYYQDSPLIPVFFFSTITIGFLGSTLIFRRKRQLFLRVE